MAWSTSSETSDEIMKILLDLATEHGVTLVVVTQDQNLAKANDRTLIIKGGSIHGGLASASESR